MIYLIKVVQHPINAWEESNLKMRQGIESLGEMDTQEQSKELMAKYEALHDTYQTTRAANDHDEKNRSWGRDSARTYR